MTNADNAMDGLTYKKFLEEVVEAAGTSEPQSMVIVGEPDACNQLRADLATIGLSGAVRAIEAVEAGEPIDEVWQGRWSRPPCTLVIAADGRKEEFLRSAERMQMSARRVVIGGYRHFEFSDRCYQQVVESLPEPSLANGYQYSRVHLYECLANAVRIGLRGLVVEFGMFRGGTTRFLAESARALGADYKIVGFDTFSGFPPKSHLFDLYDHADLADVNLADARQLLAEYDVEIVPGDITQTAAARLALEDVVLAFVDTDNYTSGRAALSAVIDRIVPGGAIVLDHFTGEDRFKYTLGERLAVQDVLVPDDRYFNLHGTGVFIRQ